MVEPNENQPVRVLQPEWFRRRSLQDEQLLPQEENFGVTRGAAPARPRHQCTEDSEKTDRCFASLPDERTGAISDGIFNSDRDV